MYGTGTPQDVPASDVSATIWRATSASSASVRKLPAAAIRIAPPGYAAKANDAVVNVGCSHGETATVSP